MPPPNIGRTASRGEVPEWLNGLVSKTKVGASPPGVRIPPSPPVSQAHGRCSRTSPARDAQGRAQSRFAIPNDQAFVGFFLCTNYVVLDPAWRSPFRGLANPLSFQTAQ